MELCQDLLIEFEYELEINMDMDRGLLIYQLKLQILPRNQMLFQLRTQTQIF